MIVRVLILTLLAAAAQTLLLSERTFARVDGPVTYDRLLHADREPHNWLTYSGTYASQRYSLLKDITRDNVKGLSLKWVWRPRYLDKMESTPLVVDGVLYTVQNSEVVKEVTSSGASLQDVALAVIADILTLFDGRLSEITSDLVNPDILGALQAADAVRLCTGEPPLFADRLLTIDAWNGTWRSVPLARRVSCATCGPRPAASAATRSDVP